ncbi:MAG: T9SS type A sorting domain-containing protein [Saprospirales bacterium]|nr:T9SS type A sorting domain-containing protein [Saprospirales bacterium]
MAKHLFRLCLFFFLATTISASAQTIDRQVVASSGGYSATPDNTISGSWTAGEIVAGPLIQPGFDLIITQGFQQPDLFDASIGVGVQDVSLEMFGIKVFPNPVNQKLIIQVDNAGIKAPWLKLFDLQGRLFQEMPLVYGHQEIDLSAMPNGSFFMHFSDADGHNALLKWLKVAR